MPLPFALLLTQTLNEAVVAEATNVMNELFSRVPQKAAVNSGHSSAL
jgi:hypothetical protein